MSQQLAFADALDAAEQLDADAQAELIAVLSRRLAERGRERVAAVVAASLKAALEQLSADAAHPPPRTHKLRGPLAGCWACSTDISDRVV